MNNHQKNMFSIGEIAKIVGITRKIILNYEVKGLICPDKKDGISGNRYYTIDTFTKIRTIRVFQEFGLTLDEIREYLSNNADLSSVIARLENMRDKLNLTIEKLKERNGQGCDFFKEITIEPQTVYVRVFDSITVADKTNILRNTALEALKKHGTDTSRRMYFTEFSLSSPNEITYCVAVPAESEGKYIRKIPAIKAVSVFHHGAYEDIPKTREKLIKYCDENNIYLSGVFRNLYLEGPPQHKDKSKFITQIIAIIKE